MQTTNRLIATAIALLAIGAALVGCTAVVTPAVSFAAEKLTISLPRMVVGQSVSETLPEAMGGKEGLVYSLSPAVPGLTFDAATRVLSGTPTTPGTHAMIYTAKDPATDGTMESVNFTITVDARPLMNRERLLGTWQLTRRWEEDDMIVGTEVDFLTFTETRFILVRSYLHMDGSFDHSWHQRGTWRITDEEIVRIWYHDDDDDDETPAVLVEFPKSYYFSGDALFVHHWADTDVEDIATNYDRMTRVVDASLSLPPLGVWVEEWHSDESDWYHISTMTLESDGTFTWSERNPHGTWTLTAEWELDLGNYFINLANATETWTETGGEPEPDDRTRGARFLRFAYAPTMSESGVRMLGVSDWDWELEEEYGNYRIEMTLQQ